MVLPAGHTHGGRSHRREDEVQDNRQLGLDLGVGDVAGSVCTQTSSWPTDVAHGHPDAPTYSAAMLWVSDFHRAFDLPRSRLPTADVSAELAQLRVDLLVEEVAELADAIRERDLVSLADALADIIYVVYGTAVTYGIHVDAALGEVHRSNMSKLDRQGRPILREDGKVLKSDRYSKPDIAGVLSRQPPLPF